MIIFKEIVCKSLDGTSTRIAVDFFGEKSFTMNKTSKQLKRLINAISDVCESSSSTKWRKFFYSYSGGSFPAKEREHYLNFKITCPKSIKIVMNSVEKFLS